MEPLLQQTLQNGCIINVYDKFYTVHLNSQEVCRKEFTDFPDNQHKSSSMLGHAIGWVHSNEEKIKLIAEKAFAKFALEVQDAVNSQALTNHLFQHLKTRSNLSLPPVCPQLRLVLHQLYFIAHEFKSEPESPFYYEDTKYCENLLKEEIQAVKV
jgi:hypothetical protein